MRLSVKYCNLSPHFFFAIFALTLLTGHAFASTPVVTVKSPASGAHYGSPVKFVASASSPDCPSGISAMRIYTAPGVSAYTVPANNLDVNINLTDGSYDTVVQAWDNCGGVGKTEVSLSVTSTTLPPPKFLYTVQNQQGVVAGYIVNPQSGELTFNGQVPVWAHWGPIAVAADSSGDHLYVANTGSFDVSAYVIDRSDGHLSPAPGANFSTGGWNTGIAVHPSNKFVYVTTNGVSGNGGNSAVAAFSVAADGSLVPVPGSPFLTAEGNIALAIDPKGEYLYTSAVGPGNANDVINAFKINQTTGALTAIAGSPYPIIPITCAACWSWEQFNDLAIDRTGKFLIGPGYENGVIYVYAIDRGTGAIAEVPGSPFVDEEPQQCEYCVGAQPFSIAVLINNSFIFVENSGQADNLVAYRLNAKTGALTIDSKTWGPLDWGNTGVIRSDPSGSFVYTLGQLAEPGTPYLIDGWMVDQSNGSLVPVPDAPYPAWNNNQTNALVITQ